jgi:hypothetical protein
MTLISLRARRPLASIGAKSRLHSLTALHEMSCMVALVLQDDRWPGPTKAHSALDQTENKERGKHKN